LFNLSARYCSYIAPTKFAPTKFAPTKFAPTNSDERRYDNSTTK
jgi:hypothetical protein